MKRKIWIIGPALVLAATVTTLKLSHAQYSVQPSAPKVESPKPSATPSPIATPMQAPTPEIVAPGQKRLSFNACNVDGPFIALTFDDGPHGSLTPRLLDILKQRGIHATFFVLGQCVVANPDIVKRALTEGHEIANHSWDHKALTKGGGSGVNMEVSQTNSAIEQACGKKPTLIRPPYGATNPTINKRLNEEFGMKVILWDVDPLDWKFRNAAHVTEEILKHTQPGSIILAHDIHPTTIDAMPGTLDALLSKGYKFVTVSELIAMDRPPQPNKKESANPASPAPTPAVTPSPAKSSKKKRQQS